MKMYTFVLALLLCACTSTQRTFYVDSITGDDANKGSSPTEAWKSLDKLNQQVFEPVRNNIRYYWKDLSIGS